MENVLFVQQFAERVAVPTDPALPQVRSSSVGDFLGGAACLAMWAVLWLLSIFAFVSPRFEREDLEARPQVSNDSAPRPSGMIELEGASFLGEEIEVRPPLEEKP